MSPDGKGGGEVERFPFYLKAPESTCNEQEQEAAKNYESAHDCPLVETQIQNDCDRKSIATLRLESNSESLVGYLDRIT
ncbi:hypothetical protein N9B60_02485 [Mariniblastus sp.]|nr:hypothetical protein [Mariniblastus sp.]